MGESHSVVKILIFIGILALLSSTLASPSYVGQPLPPNSPLSNFQSTAGNFPQFSNPFQNPGFVANVPLNQQTLYWEYPTNNTVQRPCNNITYFDCVADIAPDGNATFVTLRNFNNPSNNGGGNLAFIDFGMHGQGFDWTRIKAFSVDIFCRWTTVFTNGNRTINVQMYQALGPYVQGFTTAPSTGVCPASTTFTRITVQRTTISGNPTDANADMQLRIAYDGTPAIGSGALDISTIVVAVYFNGNAQCTGNGFFGDLSCQIKNFFDPLVQAIGVFVGILIFIGKAIGWAGSLLGAFATMIVAAVSIPGAPPLIGGIMSLIVIALLVFVGLVIFGKIRGTGNVG